MYDLIIIGGGPGGYHMAIKASNAGLKTAVIEGDKFGGTCLNVGCIPSKAFLHFSNVLREANHSIEAGLVGSKLDVDQSFVVDYKDEKVNFLVKGTEMQVKASGAEIIKGWGKVLPKEGDLFQVEVNDEIITSSKLVIATGSRTFVPSFIKGAQELYVKGDTNSPILTSDEILSLKETPKELVVIGAGIIGLEISSHFNTLGTKVTLIDVADKIAGAFDKEISNSLLKHWQKDGMTFHLESKVSEITTDAVVFEDKNGETHSVSYDKVLVAVGRQPNTDNVGLENIPELTVERGYIQTNSKLETNVEGLYAIGDVNGVSMLAHTAYREGEVIVENIKGENSEINYDIIPTVLYAGPTVGEIGINEDRAKQEGLNVSVKKLPLMYSGRFVIEVPDYSGEQFKLIVDNDTNVVIGMSLFGQYSSEIISVGSVIVGERFDVDRIKKLVFPHPTVGELIKDVVNH